MELIRSMKEIYEDVIIIVVTGGPCAGKTSLIERVVGLLKRHDFAVATLAETPTELVGANLSPSHYSTKDFQELVVRAQLRNEHIRCRGLLKMDTEKQRVLICDRGIFDSLAYADKETFNEIIQGFGVSSHGELLSRYDLVVHMTTTADGAEQHYTTENNTARTETPQQARELDRATKAAWSSHRNHRVIDNRTGFTEKIMRAIKAFSRVLSMPDAREKERKWLVTDYDRVVEFVESNNLSGVRLSQAYGEISENIEERFRRREKMDGDGVEYIYTEKAPTDKFGEREERSREITAEEFQDGVNRSDYVVMAKDRYYLYVNGYRFMIDLLDEPVRRAYVEVELVSMKEDPELPEPLRPITREVTGEDKYSAAEIVRRNS